MPLTPIGDIGVANLSEEKPSGTTLTWSVFSDWVNGTNDNTQGYDGSFSDFPTDDLSILLVNGAVETSSFGVGNNPSGVAHDPSGDGGNGTIINGSDGRGGFVEFRDRSGNLLSDFDAVENSTKGVGFFPSRDGGNGSVFTANDTDSNTLREYDKNGNLLNDWAPTSALWGCTTDDQYVYVSDSNDVYQFDPSTGSTVTSWSHGVGTQVGLGYNGHYLIAIHPTNGDVYIFEKDTGNQLFGPAGLDGGGTSDGGKGGDLIFAYGSVWFADRGANTIRKFDPGYPVSASKLHTTTTKSN